MWTLLVATGLALIVGPAAPSPAATLAETDAGQLPATAQPAQGPTLDTPLDAITGTIDSNSDQDLFKIRITDPEGFSASTDNPGTTVPDIMLYLFKEDGRGVLATDDFETRDKSKMPKGSLAGGESGVYLIGASVYYTTPTSKEGDIFELEMLGGTDTPIGAEGPGRDSPLTGWDVFPDPEEQTGSYRIELTGATFVAVPEPSSRLLIAAALASLAVLRPRARRTGA